jgi:TolB-like protein/class 3 adenylate cyclase/Tfp pilus assembly protein PilF
MDVQQTECAPPLFLARRRRLEKSCFLCFAGYAPRGVDREGVVYPLLFASLSVYDPANEGLVATQSTPRRLAAIMVADIAGFSRLMEHDESAAFTRLQHLRDAVTQPKIDAYGGRLVKTTGDGFLAEFASATAALQCALDIQRDVAAREAERSARERIRLRIGINVGDIIVDGDDVAGDGVNIAARLESLAPPDGICISGTVREQIHDDLGITLSDLGLQKLKNIAREVRAFAVMPTSRAGETRGADAPEAVFAKARQAAPELHRETAPSSIAVLPFVNLSGDEENEYFADGLADELLNVLAKIRGLRVASRTSAFFFKGKDVDIPTVARKLNVATVLEGSVRRSGQRIRVTAQLIDAATDSHLWSEVYDRTLDDIFAVQSDIATAVVAELRAALLAERPATEMSGDVITEVQSAARGRSRDPEAYRLYLQGRFYVLRITEADVARGVGFYRQALARDRAFALAWAGLSRAYHAQAGRGWLPVVEGMEQARVAARTALELEPEMPEGHIALGWVLADYDWDWKGAKTELDRARALAPGDGDVHRASASLAMQLGRLEEAIALAQRAVELDPLSKPAHVVLGDCCMRAGRLDDAVASLRLALDLAPNAGITHYILSCARLLQGRADEALDEAEREAVPYLRLLCLTLAQHTRGDVAASDAALRRLIDECGNAVSFQIAAAHAWRGEIDEAFSWLERAYRERDPGLAESVAYPLLRRLHGDPRWPALMRKMGLA